MAAGTGQAITATSIEVTETSAGAFEVGEELIADPFNLIFGPPINKTFVTPVTIMSVDSGVLTVNNAAYTAGSEVPLNAGSPLITNVEMTSGQYATGLSVGGPGITPGEQANDSPQRGFAYDSSAKTLKLKPTAVDKLPTTTAGQGVSLRADLFAGMSSIDVQEVMETLPTIGGPDALGPFNPGKSSYLTDNFNNISGSDYTFQQALGGRDLPAMSCTDVALSGGSGGCEVSTIQDGSSTPGRVVKFDSSGSYLEDLVPPGGTYTADGLAVDRSNDDVFVGGGNSHFGNSTHIVGPDAPQFSIKRYNSAGGAAVDEFGGGVISANNTNYASIVNNFRGPAFGLGVNAGSHQVYAVGLTGLNDNSVTAFSPGHHLTINVNGSGAGTVDSDKGAVAGCDKDANGVCADDYANGETVTLHATDGALSSLTGWNVSGDPGADCSDPGQDCEVTISDDVTVTATFDTNQYDLHVVKDGGGTGTVTSTSPDARSIAAPLATQSMTRTPTSPCTGWRPAPRRSSVGREAAARAPPTAW